jgi:hypothetical protein
MLSTSQDRLEALSYVKQASSLFIFVALDRLFVLIEVTQNWVEPLIYVNLREWGKKEAPIDELFITGMKFRLRGVCRPAILAGN